MTMNRRNILRTTLSSFAAVFAASRAVAATDGKQETASPTKPKVVYHLADLDKVAFVLGNIANHYDGMGGPDHVTIALVVHGPALRAFQLATANPDITRRFGQFVKAGLEPAVCAHTMRGQNVTLKDLQPGFVSADKGGVVRIAELQSQGYLYLRP
jgi:intracellular sulfur oxidation DsrE/DsrF family protein